MADLNPPAGSDVRIFLPRFFFMCSANLFHRRVPTRLSWRRPSPTRTLSPLLSGRLHGPRQGAAVMPLRHAASSAVAHSIDMATRRMSFSKQEASCEASRFQRSYIFFSAKTRRNGQVMLTRAGSYMSLRRKPPRLSMNTGLTHVWFKFSVQSRNIFWWIS